MVLSTLHVWLTKNTGIIHGRRRAYVHEWSEKLIKATGINRGYLFLSIKKTDLNERRLQKHRKYKNILQKFCTWQTLICATSTNPKHWNIDAYLISFNIYDFKLFWKTFEPYSTFRKGPNISRLKWFIEKWTI